MKSGPGSLTSLFAALTLLLPGVVHAGEGVTVALSVQEVMVRDAVALKLSSRSRWALRAVDLENGKTLIDTGSDGRGGFIPGSLVKLFVTAAALEESRRGAIDPGTSVSVQGAVTNGRLDGNIVLTGAGNAFLSSGDLQKAVEAVSSLGIREIRGDVVVDDSLFDVKGWRPKYTGPAYGMPSALGLDLHTVSVAADPALRKAVSDPLNDGLRASFNPEGRTGIRRIDDLTYEVTGAKPDARPVQRRFSLADPALFTGGVFRTLLKQAGIAVKGGVKRSNTGEAKALAAEPTEGTEEGPEQKSQRREKSSEISVSPVAKKEIARVGSRDVDSYIRDTNQHSLNVAADNLLLLLGAAKYGAPGTKEKGARAVKEFLGGAGIPLDGLNIDDGSGISEKNRVSAEQMAGFLRAASERPWFAQFLASMSRPGLDGRMKDFGYRSERMRVKSGQVRDAWCIAGYADRQAGKGVAFAFLVNGMDANTPAAGAAAVEVLRLLEQ